MVMLWRVVERCGFLKICVVKLKVVMCWWLKILLIWGICCIMCFVFCKIDFCGK